MEGVASDGALGFPGDWTPRSDPTEIPGLEYQATFRISNTNQTDKDMSAIPPTPFANLATFVDKQVIPCVEGVLTALYPIDLVKKDGTPIQYPKQNGTLTDGGLEHRITFDQKCEQPMSMKGQRIRITCNVGQHGMTGIKMDRYSPAYPKLSVTSSAHIEVVGGAPAQQTPQAPRPMQPNSTMITPRTAKPAEPEQSDDTAEVRVANWFRVFSVVCQQAGHDPVDVASKFTPSDLKEIATGTVMSFKGAYATYQAPFFNVKKSAVQAPVNEDLPSWKDYTYKGTRLEDFDAEAFNKLLEWAESNEPKSQEGRELKANLMLAKAELGMGGDDLPG